MYKINSNEFWNISYKGREISGGGGADVMMCVARGKNGHRLGFFETIQAAKDYIDQM